jgi:hypothetical protein
MPYNYHFAKLQQPHIKGALLNEDHLDRFLRLHHDVLENITLRDSVFMQTKSGLFEKNWWKAIATLYTIARTNKKIKTLAMDNCQDAIQTALPFPAFAVDFDGTGGRVVTFKEVAIVASLEAVLKSQVPYVLPEDVVVTENVMRNKPSAMETEIHEMMRVRMEDNKMTLD